MLSTIMALLGSLPVIGNIVTAITGAFFNAKVAITTARIGGDRDVAVELVKASAVSDHESSNRLGIIASSKVLVWILVAFATPLIIFEWKGIVYDNVLGLGSTDPIRGQLADWANTIIYSIFGSGTTLALGRMWFGRSNPA